MCSNNLIKSIINVSLNKNILLLNSYHFCKQKLQIIELISYYFNNQNHLHSHPQEYGIIFFAVDLMSYEVSSFLEVTMHSLFDL